MTAHRTSNLNYALSNACIAIALVTLSACGSTANPSSNATPAGASNAGAPPASANPGNMNPVGTGATTAAHIDNAVGGTVALPDGATIHVPPGALPAGVDSITITSASEPAPAAYTALSPVYEFGPAGTVFSKALTVSIPFTALDASSFDERTIMWSRARGDGFDMLPTQFTSDPSGAASSFVGAGEVRHFSVGFVGAKFMTDPHPVTDPYAGK